MKPGLSTPLLSIFGELGWVNHDALELVMSPRFPSNTRLKDWREGRGLPQTRTAKHEAHAPTEALIIF